MASKHKLNRNLKLFNWYQALNRTTFLAPIIVPFLTSFELNLSQIFLIQSIFAFSMIILEIPSGAFADRFGRKLSILFGYSCSFFGGLFYLFGNQFWHFAIGEAIWGIGASFVSGADVALIYDSLKDLGREHEFKKLYAHSFRYFYAGSMITVLFGGYAMNIHLRLLMLLTLLLFIGLIVISSFFTEAKKHRASSTHWNNIKQAVHYVYCYSKLRLLTIFSSVIGFSLLMGFWFIQPIFQQLEIPIVYFGLLFAIYNLFGIFGSQLVNPIEQYLGTFRSLLLIGSVLTILFLVLGSKIASWAIILLVLHQSTWGFSAPLFTDIINVLVPRQYRATILSIQGFGTRALFFVLAPAYGYIADHFSLQYALLYFGVALGIVLIPIFFLLAKHDFPKVIHETR